MESEGKKPMSEKQKRKALLKQEKKEKYEAKMKQREIQKQKQGESTKRNQKKIKKQEIKVEFVNKVVSGERKETRSSEMNESYDPVQVESAWYDWWHKKGFFKPFQDEQDEILDKDKFVMVIPPPNVTGQLHLGHALTNSIEDCLIRYHKMCGDLTLWLPGTDHAGIATQVVVEKRIMKEKGLSRHDLGRDAFIEEVWKWKEEKGGRIKDQLKRLGSCLDWDREVFTMDSKLSRAVVEAFVRMHDSGLIYRAKRLVNWSCSLNTAISDIEVDYIELTGPTDMTVPGHDKGKTYKFGILEEFAYPVVGTDEEIIVATTRIETMLADTAVAIHPQDERYKHLHGKKVQHPFFDRQLPIVLDDQLVKMDFGTGAVKVTPAHDPNDFACGKRHNLPFINMLNDDGTLNEEGGGRFAGMKRFDARNAVLAAIKEMGLHKGTKPNPKMSLALCSRSGDVIEPLLKPQWWVHCKGMAQKAIDAVANGDVEIIPNNHIATWNRWLQDIHEWCISRQLWWGHRCPAYLVTLDGEIWRHGPKSDDNEEGIWLSARNDTEALERAKAKMKEMVGDEACGGDWGRVGVLQDPDVLDTWFSSGLFPFSSFGWPDVDLSEYKRFFPNTLLETGHDILFFWVARMVMMSLELTGESPFKQVFLHAMVRDAQGRKMSKSLGNVIDPVDMITGIDLADLHGQLRLGNLAEKEIKKAEEGQKINFPKGIPECGTDATRFALCAYTTQGRNINLDVNRVAAYRHFCNKIWNAARYALIFAFGYEKGIVPLEGCEGGFLPNEDPPTPKFLQTASPLERWILSRLSATIEDAQKGWTSFDFGAVTTAIYNFFLYDMCDFYLEGMKTIRDDSPAAKRSAQETLYTCFDNGLRLLHPFMPFISEELYQRFPHRKNFDFETIMIAPYPKELSFFRDQEVEKDMQLSQKIIHSIRSMRTCYGLTKEKPKLILNFFDEGLQDTMAHFTDLIRFLGKGSETELVLNVQEPPAGCAVEIIDGNCQVFVQIKGMVDIPSELTRLKTKIERLQKEEKSLIGKMESPHYHKVPKNVQESHSQRKDAISSEITAATKATKTLQAFI